MLVSLNGEFTQKLFWWNPRAFWPCIDSSATDTFKAQKCSKDIVKIVNFHQWFNHNFIRKEKKNNGFIQQFFSEFSNSAVWTDTGK